MLSFGHFGGAAADESESVCSFQSVQLGGASLNSVSDGLLDIFISHSESLLLRYVVARGLPNAFWS